MSDKERDVWDEAHARKHFGQLWGQYPVLPYHESGVDALHLLLNLWKVGIAQSIHVHLHKKFSKPAMKEYMASLKERVNARMKEDFTRLKFGGDGLWACTGPQMKRLLRGGHNGALLVDLITLMSPYWDMLATDGQLPKTAANEEEGDAAADAEVAAVTASAGRGRGSTSGARGSARGGRGGGGRGRGGKAHEVTIAAEDEVEDEEGEGAEAGGARTGSPTPDVDPSFAEASTAVPYKTKVMVFMLSFSRLYQGLHEDHDTRASSILPAQREQKARQMSKLGTDVAQASLALCGTGIRQTYLHDAVYGWATLYMVLGKAYLGATEGNEAAHQRMKRIFRQMCSHSNKRISDALQLMNIAHLFTHAVDAYGQWAPPTKESESRLDKDMGLKVGKRTVKDHDAAIAYQDEHLKAQKTGAGPSKEAP